jgi:hypothetical protein
MKVGLISKVVGRSTFANYAQKLINNLYQFYFYVQNCLLGCTAV